MTKQIRFVFVLLALGLLSYWLLLQKHPSSPVAQATIIHRTATGLPDSVRVSAGPHYYISAFKAFFLGQHNRDVWTAPVEAKVFYLNRDFGGLKIMAVGGGMQTLSFTLTDSIGRTYALRSVDKDPISVLPPFWQKTFAGYFVRDQISGANPYGALIVPVLAEAAGIFHAHPQLRYVRLQDPLFKSYANRAGGKLFLIEEKHINHPDFYPELKAATAIVNTTTLLQNQQRSKRHRINEDQYLKCRLFDFLIGDWDRHNGQWMWAAYRQGSDTWYVPIPKDRDQAFCNYRDGLLPWLATRSWAMPKFGQFSAKLNNINGLVVNAAYLDSLVLSKVPVEKFIKAAQDLQHSLPDAVINKSVQAFPVSVQKLRGTEIKNNLKARRRQLPNAAREFYKIINHR